MQTGYLMKMQSNNPPQKLLIQTSDYEIREPSQLIYESTIFLTVCNLVTINQNWFVNI